MSNTTKMQIPLGAAGLVLLAALFWTPTAMADGESSKLSPMVPSELLFGPEKYSLRGSTSNGQTTLTLSQENGKSFNYLEGQQITISDGQKSLVILIAGQQVSVGNKLCSSNDTPCIVHAIRKQLKKLTRDDAAKWLAVLKDTLSGPFTHTQFGEAIGKVFLAMATMPVTDADK
jgi:hypothetical protein